jgi:Zn-dependent protease
MSTAPKPSHPGSLLLFQSFGIPVFVHWSWGLLLGFFVLMDPLRSGPTVSTLALIGLFAIVVLHEFGHALAAKSVGGTADRIVLTPLGGVAYAQAPPRPWPFLWTIAAGPLVNVLLVPVLAIAVAVFGAFPGWVETVDGAGNVVSELDFASLTTGQLILFYLNWINIMLLIFNLLPIYPLDGGQILQGLLWLFMGRARSLGIAATIGLVASLALAILIVLTGFQIGSWLMFFIAIFLALQSFRSLAVAKVLAMMERQHGRHVEPWELGRGVRGGVGVSSVRGPGVAGGGRGGGGEVIEGEVVDRR